MVQTFIGEKAGGVESQRPRTKDGRIRVELAEGTEDCLACAHCFTTNSCVFSGLAGDGGVVVDAENFVPYCVKVGAV